MVVLSLPNLPDTASTMVIDACEREGLELALHPALFVVSPSRLSVDKIGGEPVLYYRAHYAQPANFMLKQISDNLGLLRHWSPWLRYCCSRRS